MTNEKYILHICAYAAPYPGNFINSLTALAEECNSQGIGTVFAFPDLAKKNDWCQALQDKYEVFYVPLSKARINIKTYYILTEIFKEKNIFIAHSHFELYDIPLSICAPKNVKVYWHLHDAIDMIYERNGIIRRLIMKLQYGLFGKRVILLAVAERTKRFAIELGFTAQNAFYVPNGLDTKRFKDISNKKKTEDNTFMIFGWDYYRKGVDILLSTLAENVDLRCKCMVVCDESVWEDTRLKAYAQQDNRVVRVNPVSSVADLYSITSCFLHISRAEGLSYALLEAIYSGNIVVSSNIEQNMFAAFCPYVYYVPVGNTQELGSVMQRVVNGELLQSKSDIYKSRQIIDRDYSVSAWTKKIMMHYGIDGK